MEEPASLLLPACLPAQAVINVFVDLRRHIPTQHLDDLSPRPQTILPFWTEKSNVLHTVLSLLR